MGLIKYAAIGALTVLALSGFFLSQPKSPPRLPEPSWRPESKPTEVGKIQPFKITFPEDVIQDLKVRLKQTRGLKPPLKGTGWSYGISNEFLKSVLDYWSNKYNMTEREKYLNQYPQFKTNIQGLDIHFLHVKPKNAKGKRVLPLLMQHGWPGSIVEFYKIIPMLTEPRDDYDFVFEVVAPSLPGFGFSSAATVPGLGAMQMAVILKNLMLTLGHEQFYTQGGDWGAVITADMASMFPKHVLGMHSNLCAVIRPWTILKVALYSFFPSLIVEPENYHLMYPFKRHLELTLEMTGYLHIQATKPDTVGVGVSDSPAGLAAYILEKFGMRQDEENGGILGKLSLDELIDNLMIYWLSDSMTTAMRIYAESFNKKAWAMEMASVPITVPSACAQFPNEIIYQPASILKDRFVNLVRVTRMPRGGHFAAFEEPRLLADDVWASINEMEKLRKQKQESSTK